MAYMFDSPESDGILRSMDGEELHIHKLVLILASPVFQAMFSLPQSTTETSSQIPTIEVSEPSDILQPFLQFIYPLSQPKIPDLPMWEALYTVADKYAAGGVMDSLKDILVHRFLKTSPLRVYALASHWGFENVAKIASAETLRINVFKDLPQEDAALMGGTACQRLYVLHSDRREAARSVIDDLPDPPSSGSCDCNTADYIRLLPEVCMVLPTTPWITAEAIFEDFKSHHEQSICNDGCCCNSFKNMRKSFTLILKDVSKLPHTI